MLAAGEAATVEPNEVGSGSCDVTGVVLAGGASTRFADGDKILATVDGTAILRRVVGTLESATGRAPLLAVRTARQRATYERVLAGEVPTVLDAPNRSGPLAGLAAAAAAAPSRWLFVVGADMPLLSAAAVRWLLDRIQGTAAAVPRSVDGTLQPLHAAYERAAVREGLAELPPGASLRELLDTLAPVRTVNVADVPPAVPLAASLTNVNTVTDLAAVRGRLADADGPDSGPDDGREMGTEAGR